MKNTPSALKWLAEKRARIAHDLEQTERIAADVAKRLGTLRLDLAALDRAVRLHDPTVDPKSDLARVVRLLQTVRNNLFHGGKHGGAGWDDPTRTELLLKSGIRVLNQFATLAGVEADYEQIY